MIVMLTRYPNEYAWKGNFSSSDMKKKDVLRTFNDVLLTETVGVNIFLFFMNKRVMTVLGIILAQNFMGENSSCCQYCTGKK